MYGYLGVSLGVLNASLVEISIQGQPTSPFVLVTPSPPDALHSNYAAASMRCSDLTARICLDPVLAPVVIGSVFGFRFHHSFVMRPELPHYPPDSRSSRFNKSQASSVAGPRFALTVSSPKLGFGLALLLAVAHPQIWARNST